VILGIDEAGRGPVLGPLVLGGVAVDECALGELASWGVQDSKAFGSSSSARRRRQELAERIVELAAVRIEIADPEEVDRWAAEGGLNRLERTLAGRIIEATAGVTKVVADGARIFGPLQRRYPLLPVDAHDRADESHVLVAAASIVAKAERDRRLASLLEPWQAEFGPIGGGGYPNAATARFLRAFVERRRVLPPGVRLSWGWKVLQLLRGELNADS